LSPTAPKPKVVYVCGHGRSGSSLLGNMLGELGGWCSIGEVRRLYEALEVGDDCGCGERIDACPFWTSVRDRASKEVRIPEGQIHALQRSELRLRPQPMLRMLATRPGESPHSSRLAACAEILEALYRGIAEVAEAHVIVDSSKGPHDAYLAEKFTHVDFYLVHLVRDPRAVANSWRRRHRQIGQRHRYEPNPRAPFAFALIRWMLRNSLAELLLRRRLGPRYMRIRYEDFVRDPAGMVARICDLAGEPRQELPGLAGGVIDFGVHHTAGGSLNRGRTGRTPIELDTEWESALSTREKTLATAATLPLLLRYRYPITVRSASKE
jgi:hypothetical protein